jgi:hypothetical protein
MRVVVLVPMLPAFLVGSSVAIVDALGGSFLSFYLQCECGPTLLAHLYQVDYAAGLPTGL